MGRCHWGTQRRKAWPGSTSSSRMLVHAITLRREHIAPDRSNCTGGRCMFLRSRLLELRWEMRKIRGIRGRKIKKSSPIQILTCSTLKRLPPSLYRPTERAPPGAFFIIPFSRSASGNDFGNEFHPRMLSEGGPQTWALYQDRIGVVGALYGSTESTGDQLLNPQTSFSPQYM